VQIVAHFFFRVESCESADVLFFVLDHVDLTM
jgi:hypothetical protein